jgi:hypothetical protein
MLDEEECNKVLQDKNFLKSKSEEVNRYIKKSYNNFKFNKDSINKIEFINDNSHFKNDVDYEMDNIKNEVILSKKNKDYQSDSK